MTIYYLPNTYTDLLNHVDMATGRLTWVVDVHHYDRKEIPERAAGLLAHRRALVNHMLCLLNMWVTDRPLTTSEVKVRALDPIVKPHPTSEAHVLYSINVCPIFGLPGDDPTSELTSIRTLLNAIKLPLDWFIEQNPDNLEEARCQFFNSRKTPIGQSVEFHWGEGLLDDAGNEKMRQATRGLHVLIEGDPNLMLFMTWLRRQFNSMGPHSWWTVKQEYLYEQHQAPSDERFRRLFKGPTWKEVDKLRKVDRKTLK